jgi:hypothetical protein
LEAGGGWIFRDEEIFGNGGNLVALKFSFGDGIAVGAIHFDHLDVQSLECRSDVLVLQEALFVHMRCEIPIRGEAKPDDFSFRAIELYDAGIPFVPDEIPGIGIFFPIGVNDAEGNDGHEEEAEKGGPMPEKVLKDSHGATLAEAGGRFDCPFRASLWGTESWRVLRP